MRSSWVPPLRDAFEFYEKSQFVDWFSSNGLVPKLCLDVYDGTSDKVIKVGDLMNPLDWLVKFSRGTKHKGWYRSLLLSYIATRLANMVSRYMLCKHILRNPCPITFLSPICHHMMLIWSLMLNSTFHTPFLKQGTLGFSKCPWPPAL